MTVKGKVVSGLSLPNKLIDVILQGTAPLLMHKMNESALIKTEGRRRKDIVRTPKEVAEEALYRLDNGCLYFPGDAIRGVCAEIGAGLKGKGRKSLKTAVGGGVTPPEFIELWEPAYDAHGRWNKIDWRPARHWAVDTRTGVNHNSGKNGVRVLIHRPRLNFWQARFSIIVNELCLNTSTVLQMLKEGGDFVGIGAFRPAKLGSFGRFDVRKFEIRENYLVPSYEPLEYNPEFDMGGVR